MKERSQQLSSHPPRRFVQQRILQAWGHSTGAIPSQALPTLGAVPGKLLVLPRAQHPLQLQDKQDHRDSALMRWKPRDKENKPWNIWKEAGKAWSADMHGSLLPTPKNKLIRGWGMSKFSHDFKKMIHFLPLLSFLPAYTNPKLLPQRASITKGVCHHSPSC